MPKTHTMNSALLDGHLWGYEPGTIPRAFGLIERQIMKQIAPPTEHDPTQPCIPKNYERGKYKCLRSLIHARNLCPFTDTTIRLNPFAETVGLLQNAEFELKDIVDCVFDFACWWKRVKSDITALKFQVEVRSPSSIRVSNVQVHWEGVKNTYVDYNTKVRLNSHSRSHTDTIFESDWQHKGCLVSLHVCTRICLREGLFDREREGERT
jgi:hypothetical protein